MNWYLVAYYDHSMIPTHSIGSLEFLKTNYELCKNTSEQKTTQSFPNVFFWCLHFHSQKVIFLVHIGKNATTHVACPSVSVHSVSKEDKQANSSLKVTMQQNSRSPLKRIAMMKYTKRLPYDLKSEHVAGTMQQL